MHEEKRNSEREKKQPLLEDSVDSRLLVNRIQSKDERSEERRVGKECQP